MTLRRFRPMRGPLGIAGFRRRAAISAWSPLDLSPTIWHDPSSASWGTKTGNLVDQLDDLSGNGNHCTGTTTTRPDHGTRTINSLNAIDFDDAASECLTYGSGIFSGDISFWAAFVVQFDDFSADRTFFAYGDTNAQIVAKANGTTAAAGFTWDSNGINQAYACFNTTQAHLFEIEYNAGTNVMKVFVNGVECLTQGFVTPASISGTTNLHLGKQASTSQFLDGLLGEIVMCTTIPSDANKALYRAYIRDKWALPGLANLSTIFTYRWEADRLSTMFTTSAKSTPVANDADPVGAWSDIDDTLDLIQATSTKRPSFVLAERAVKGDGTDDYLDAAIAAGAKTIVVVVKEPSAANDKVPLSVGATSDTADLKNAASGGHQWRKKEDTTSYLFGDTVTNANIFALRVVSASSMFMSLNGGAETEIDPNDAVHTGTKLTLFRGGSGFSYGAANIRAVYLDPSDIGTADLATAIAAIKARFAV